MPVGHFQASAETISAPTFVVSKRLKIALGSLAACAFILAVSLGLPRMGFGNAGMAPQVDSSSQSQTQKPTEVPLAVGKDAWKMVSQFRALDFNVSPTDTQREYIYGDEAELKVKLSGSYVCYQTLVPGTPITANQEILFEIGPECKGKADSMLAGSFAKAVGVWSPSDTGVNDALDNSTLDGWVVNFGDEYQPELVTLLTLYGEVTVSLAKIEPLDSWCNSETADDDTLISAAMDARNALLPRESPVRVVFAAGVQQSDGYLHRLSTTGLLTDGETPNNSVNEQLVKSGTWLPDDLYTEETSTTVAPAKRTWKLSGLADDATVDELAYLKLLLAAANSQKKAPTNLMVDCLAAAQAYWLKVELPYIQSTNQGSIDGGSSGGVNVGRCWVNPYVRNGHWVRGYYRNC